MSIQDTRIIKEPIGVCALITPWNWPMNQITLKVIPALATGCTMILKPSEQSPMSGILFSEIMHEAGVPAGVYNMVNGDGPGVGSQLSAHPDVDMVSFTGSTRAGRAITIAGAETIKRVSLELGGKGANLILPMPIPKRSSKASSAVSTTPVSPVTRQPACWSSAPATIRLSKKPSQRQTRRP